MKKYIKNLSKTSIMHYMKLFVRGSFFITAVILYLTGDIEAVSKKGIFPLIVWLWYFVEMVLRLFPTGMESMGCEKVFKKNYHPPKVEREPKNQSAKTTFIVALVWFALNGAIFALHFIFPKFVDKYVLALVALAYGVCDIICILFFCPFQTWFMKNRCCTTCRIYNWDFAMLCTPFLLIPSFYTYSLLGMALIILAKWEITYKLHPERFSERTNESLRCKNCTEKLCKHKVQLQHYIKKNKDILFERLEPVVEKLEPAFNLIDGQADGIEETVSHIEEGIHETYEKVKDKTVEAYGKVKDKTEEKISAAAEVLRPAFDKVEDGIRTAYDVVKDKTKEILGIEKSEPAEKTSEPAPADEAIDTALIDVADAPSSDDVDDAVDAPSSDAGEEAVVASCIENCDSMEEITPTPSEEEV